MSNIIELDKIKNLLNQFSEARDWEKFHSPKNLSMAIAGEAGELLEIFQWLTEKESEALKNSPEIKTHISRELADIMLYIIRLADKLEIDLNTAIFEKLYINHLKYPIDKVKGSAKKYTEYS